MRCQCGTDWSRRKELYRNVERLLPSSRLTETSKYYRHNRMPSLELKTNVRVPDVKAFVQEFSQLSAKVLRKPEQYITVLYTHNEALSFHGTFDPAFTMTITSLDNINPELNEEYSAVFFEYFSQTLGVPGERGYITFYDPGRAYLGHQGTTFATIFNK